MTADNGREILTKELEEPESAREMEGAQGFTHEQLLITL